MPSEITPATGALLEVRDLKVHFPVRGGLFSRSKKVVHAVDGVSLDLREGETLGLVGESGCGKTTTGNAILRRVPITGGEVRFRGRDITEVGGRQLRTLRREFQMIFQDPYSSLNPRMRVGEIIAEPLLVHGVVRGKQELRDRVLRLLTLCGLHSDAIDRYPHAFSGGQRQRIAVARAIALEPPLIVADEPTSALDVSIQAQVVNLLKDLQNRLGITYLFISHNLAIVRHMSDRIAIMYAGKLVEVAPPDQVYDGALHPYTKSLLSAVPVPDPTVERKRERIVLRGDVPNPVDPPSGCRFRTRCPYVQPRCADEVPPLRKVGRHEVACHFAEEIERGELKPAEGTEVVLGGAGLAHHGSGDAPFGRQ